MKETVKELEKKLKELSDKSINFIKAMDALALIGFEDVEKKRKMIDDLRQMEHKVGEKRQNVIDAIGALQKVCTHTYPDGKSAFRGNGNDSHYSYEKCEICGKEEKC
jgi:hypothetical protein